MKFDLFLSICQTEVDGYLPTERVMFDHFFDQIRLADELGFGVAWVAETHLSCEIQKKTKNPVIPHFIGEIGLNTDILQLAHKVFACTKQIEVGSAIRNILCNGGPIAHAESVRTFLALHGLNQKESRRLHLGFASGRFDFSNRPYGFVPRDALEEAAWPVVKGKILNEATEIFLRLLKGEIFSSAEVEPRWIDEAEFRTPQDWQKVISTLKPPYRLEGNRICLRKWWEFETLGVIPREVDLKRLALTIGTHDAQTQILANRILPTGVFNLSITPAEVIEQTHARMQSHYHPSGGPWRRELMPRTAMLFVDATAGLSAEQQSVRAKTAAERAWLNYWKAMEGTIDQKKVDQAVSNTLAGNPQELIGLIKEKYHPEDRLMLWFDFNNHDNEAVKTSMRVFMQKIAPHLR